ncbi:PEP-CTERM sorting domain-containing protein [bacterium]|nr:PEP-CTERM sorting domain-containing protein [bacterium]
MCKSSPPTNERKPASSRLAMFPFAIQSETVLTKKAQRSSPTVLAACGLLLLAMVSARAEEQFSTVGSSLNSSTISGYVDSTVAVRSDWASSGPAAASEWLTVFPSTDYRTPAFDFTDRLGAADVHEAVSVVPEPSSLALLLAGAITSGVLVQRRKRSSRTC